MKIAIPKIKPTLRRARYLARRRAQRRARYLARRRLAARIRARQRALARRGAQQRRFRNNRYNQNRSQGIQINILLRNILQRYIDIANFNRNIDFLKIWNININIEILVAKYCQYIAQAIYCRNSNFWQYIA